MLDVAQQLAVSECVDTTVRLVAVTGPAGSGKTTIIKEVADRLTAMGIAFAICAPTGKAARRVKEATGYEALTIHRLLEYSKPGEIDVETGLPMFESGPRRTKEAPLSQKVVIADEYAMVGTELHRNLVDALKPGACIRMFGDLAQLPPIEDKSLAVEYQRTSPFQRVIESRRDRGSGLHELQTVYRQAEGGELLIAANKVRRGITPARSDEFQVKFTERPVDELLAYVLDSGYDFRSLDHQIITPMRKNWIGTHALNTQLQMLLNPDHELGIVLPRKPYDAKTYKGDVRVSVGDKVVCTENTYEMRDYEERFGHTFPSGLPDPSSYIPTPDNKMMLNGEIGIVHAIRPDGTLEIDFGDRIVEVPCEFHERFRDKSFMVDPRTRIDLAYALTTHKVQGSEFQTVVYVINKSAHFMLNRKNFYTAVTRARKKAYVISDMRSWSRSLGAAG